MEQVFFTSMYLEKGPIIKKYLMKNGCQEEDAEDIVQETFIKAMTYMVHLEATNVTAWLFKVAINRYYDLCRKKKKHPSVAIEAEHFMEKFIEEDRSDEGLIKEEVGKQVRMCLEQLTPMYTNLLLMKYEMDLSYKQIGEMVDMKEEKVKTYIYRARQQFKKQWEER